MCVNLAWHCNERFTEREREGGEGSERERIIMERERERRVLCQEGGSSCAVVPMAGSEFCGKRVGVSRD